ncbi:hypothetical protein BX257_3256 [Streptomyces sp. 3212.3]|uniref:hypothetical protein n=1 Tax=unclassified Streptomyces TaxID=2593676 RepID=UPI000E25B1FC|nr:hypothetical protein [Streptomyces sp. 3212.3]REE60710.1 hypothetical protein BX257_3256 [Streptomyces sp. 3212.3]
MDLEKPPQRQSAEGCLTLAIRLPVRIVVFVLVVPVRMLWDALVVGGRFVRGTVLRPVGHALVRVAWAVLVWPWVTVWRYVLVPLGRGVTWLGRVLVVAPALWFHRYVLTPFGRGAARVSRAIGAGAVWVYGRVLTPVGHVLARLLKGVGYVLTAVGAGVRAAVAWFVGHVVVVPAGWLHRYVLTPFGHGVVRLADGAARLVRVILHAVGAALFQVLYVLLVLPALAVRRWVLTPVGHVLAVVGREIAAAFGHAWRVAGHLSLAVGRFLGTLLRWFFVQPVGWLYRTVLTPVGHVLRETVLRPAVEAARAAGRATRQALAAAHDSARQARADLRRMLFGDPGQPQAVSRREPKSGETRTLGSSTTALTKD